MDTLANILATLLVLGYALSPVGYLFYRAYKLAQLERLLSDLRKGQSDGG